MKISIIINIYFPIYFIRIKSQALSLEDLLPENLREVQQHSAELPVYAWVNLIKTEYI
jgi:hypothetical protein